MSLMQEEEGINGENISSYFNQNNIRNSSSSVISNGSFNSNAPGYTVVEPSFEIPRESEKSIAHPVSKTSLFMLIAISIALPFVIYMIATNLVKEANHFPFYLVLIPSILVGVPAIFMVYRFFGAQPFIRRRPILLLMSASFGYYSLFVPIYLLYLIRPAYFIDYQVRDDRKIIVDQFYTGYSWLGAIPICYLHGCVFIQYLMLSQCKMRSRIYLYFVSYPASVFFTSVIISFPFLLFIGFLPNSLASFLMLVPMVLSIVCLFYTTRTRSPNKWIGKDICITPIEEDEDLLISKKFIKRTPLRSPSIASDDNNYLQPLSIIQIADPHLGPMMSVERLRTICEHTVHLNPDLVLLTGDFFTTESFYPVNSLENALEPLKELKGKVYACLGNHDYEEGCLEILEKGLQSIGCKLLVDECVIANTRIGKVQIIGFDYRHKGRNEHIEKVIAAFPKLDMPRIGLLHDPGAFKFIPHDYGIMVFSGHTHGGQIGLNCFGINFSLVGMTGMPDHSLWQNSNNYLYVHTGQGCRSLLGTMVLRVGVPTEDSVVYLHFDSKMFSNKNSLRT
eukprot:gene5611-6983_t